MKRLARHILHFFCFMTAGLVAGCGGGGEGEMGGGSPPVVDASAVHALLQQPLWQARDAYDASHYMMVPMHAAFVSGANDDIVRFGDFFAAFSVSNPQDLAPERLDRLHFLYLYSRYISLVAQRSGCGSTWQKHFEKAHGLWAGVVSAPAWQWDRPDFPSLFDRVAWKLENKGVAPSYYRAIIDEDLFALAIGADLSASATACGLPRDPLFDRSVALADAVYEQEVAPTSAGGWVFQKGVWSDHPDFAYAGQPAVAPNLEPAKVPDISPDSSHSFRQPLFLISFSCAHAAGSMERARFRELARSLGEQVLARVLLLPGSSFNGVRMTNYMDGENGVYRYNYVTQGVGNGYGPYELSGSFNLGWWSFLGPTLTGPYQAQRSSLPFGSPEIATYTGPNTTRVRNPEFSEPNFYRGTLIHEVLDASLVVSSNTKWCQ